VVVLVAVVVVVIIIIIIEAVKMNMKKPRGEFCASIMAKKI
jgi:hypothetical protein